MTKIPSYILEYARQDVQACVNTLSDKYPNSSFCIENFTVKQLFRKTFTSSFDISKRVNDVKYIANASMRYEEDKKEVYCDKSVESICASLSRDLRKSSISSKIHVKGSYIKAADEDEFDFDDMDEDLDDDSSFEDIDEDVEEEFDLIEDDEQIETDNNIDNHYIVECDNCQGVFISALLESSEPVKQIHGICPLCNKESDQYIKWVVKSVDNDEFEDDEDLDEFNMMP